LNLGIFNLLFLIDLAICYESLFSKKGDMDSCHKLALKLARLIGNDFDDRIHYYQNIKNLYGERSTIMHGSQLEKPSHLAMDRYESGIAHKEIIDRIDFD
jgi:Apea-like HEPN